jgi:DNA-binding TFAR19-related protein (PDSD5 family)
MTKHNDALLGRLNRHVHSMQSHDMNQEAILLNILLTEARDEIERLNVSAACCAEEVERLCKWINAEFRGRHIKIVSMKIDDKDG